MAVRITSYNVCYTKLLRDRPPVRYLAESPEHAVGELLSPFRGTTFHPAYLRQGGRPIALVEVLV